MNPVIRFGPKVRKRELRSQLIDDSTVQTVFFAAEQFLRPYEVDERTDADFHVATADGGRLGFQGPVAVFVAPRGEHDVDRTDPCEDSDGDRITCKVARFELPVDPDPSGISSTRQRG